MFRYNVHSFHFWGATGLITGITLSLWLANYTGLSIGIAASMILVSIAVFLLLAWCQKIIYGKEVLVYYHHEIAVVLAVTTALGLLHQPVLPFLDISILGVGTFLAFGRLGCFNAGCCHGKPFKIGCQYGTDHVIAGFPFYYERVKLFPVQLLEALYVTLIVVTGVVLIIHQSAPGTVLIVYTVLYGSLRYLVEFFRGDPERPYWAGLSEAQWTTLLLVGISLLLASLGYLPFHVFHLVAFIVLLAISVRVILVRDHSLIRLTNPKHVHEMAAVLDYLSGKEYNTHPMAAKQTVAIASTSAGLCISKGTHLSNNGVVTHYTISGKDNFSITDRVAKKVAAILQWQERFTMAGQIIKKENHVYHIIFEQHDPAVTSTWDNSWPVNFEEVKN